MRLFIGMLSLFLLSGCGPKRPMIPATAGISPATGVWGKAPSKNGTIVITNDQGPGDQHYINQLMEEGILKCPCTLTWKGTVWEVQEYGLTESAR